MSTLYRILRISISLINIAIAGIVITSVWPFAMGEFTVDMPDSNDLVWSYSSGSIVVSAPVTVDNGGFYDINDVVITANVENLTHHEFLNVVIPWGTIYAGSRTTYTVQLTLDLEQLFQTTEYMVFHSDDFVVEMGLKCKYTFRLIEFTATYQVPYHWDALIKQLNVSKPYLSNNAGQFQMSIPYTIWTSSILQGYSGSVTITVRNGTNALIAQGSEPSIPLGTATPFNGNLTLNLSLAAGLDLLYNDQTLTLDITAGLPPAFTFTTTTSMGWVAPL